MIEVADLTVAFDEVTAIEGVDLAVDAEEFVTIVGPSGCGKTTLLRAVGGLESPSAGRIRVDGAPPDAAQEAGRIGFVFQEHTLLPWKTAVENVVFLRRMAGKDPAPERARRLLATAGLAGYEDVRPHALSGGMKQRVAIARAIHLGADVLLMDEPLGELDELTRDEMGTEILRIWRETRKTVLFVTHSVPEAVLLGDRCVVLDGSPGRVRRVLDVDLPRPRDRGIFETAAFQSRVATVRELLDGAAE